MNQKGFINTILVIAIVIITGTIGYFVVAKEKALNTTTYMETQTQPEELKKESGTVSQALEQQKIPEKSTKVTKSADNTIPETTRQISVENPTLIPTPTATPTPVPTNTPLVIQPAQTPQPELTCQDGTIHNQHGVCTPLALSEYKCKEFLYSGDPEKKINLFFISDGFNNSNIDAFKKNVEWALDLNGTSNGLFSKTPYRDNKNLFNIYTISSEKIFDCLSTHNSGPNALPCDANKILDIPKESCGVSKVDYVILAGYPYSPVNPDERRSGIWNADKLSVLFTDITDPSRIQMSMNHEVGGHGIGGLGDEYYLSNQYKESWNIWPNIDKPGCPKWCSGEINTEALCYQTYLEWENCIKPSYLDQTCRNGDHQYSCGISENINACHAKAYQKEMDAGRFLPNCDIGLSCISETGCYWGGGYSLANFRSTKDGIMYATYLGGTYGHIGETEIMKRINEALKNLYPAPFIINLKK